MSITIGLKMTQPLAGMPTTGFVGEMQDKQSTFFSGKSVQAAAVKASSTENVGREVEADITRDDQIGRWCKDAFTLSAPAMPEVLKG